MFGRCEYKSWDVWRTRTPLWLATPITHHHPPPPPEAQVKFFGCQTWLRCVVVSAVRPQWSVDPLRSKDISFIIVRLFNKHGAGFKIMKEDRFELSPFLKWAKL